MSFQTVVNALCVIAVSCGLAWGAECPLCLRQIPDGEKFCERHKAEIAAKKGYGEEERKRVDAVIAARAAYLARVEEAVTFYEGRADAEGLRKSRLELADLRAARKLVHQEWEKALPELSATMVVPEADVLLAEGDRLRKKKWNPLKRGARLREAAPQYQAILQKYPNSTAVDSAAFGLGEIYASMYVKEYRRAVTFFELAYLARPTAKHEALYRAAKVCDDDLASYEEATRFYWLASQKGVSVVTRKKASLRLKQLQKKGYGAAYAANKEEPAVEK